MSNYKDFLDSPAVTNSAADLVTAGDKLVVTSVIKSQFGEW